MASNLPDLETLYRAGIDPVTKLPLALRNADTVLKQDIKKLLRIVDEQDAINRYVWYNLPDGLDEIIERVLYYKGQGMFFYMSANDRFYFLPFALNGGIDVYGRFMSVTPVPFGGTTSEKDGGKEKPWIEGLKRDPMYEVSLEPYSMDLAETKCVLLSDYCKQISQTTLARQLINEPLLDVMANCIPFMNTGLQNSTGTLGMRVNNQDEYSNVLAANRSVKNAALVGDKYVPIVANVEFQEMTGTNVSVPSDFMQALESLDNFRLGLYGIENGGIFQKKAHMLNSEQAMAGGGNSVGLVYQDGLKLRQRFCDIVNSIWGLGIWCDSSETEVGDQNYDGVAEDDQDQSGLGGEGTQPVEVLNE